ncbi:MAG: hypothetical protein COT71_00770 [Candidatus Andersenbacteria bacterium CG10_big_fil_rev_8_21_14_0_10_54_11]|uniref:Uncharacterized protein n=1 Tax=Candidatus Andersenbacteria bacterium CG10_big_fil_rev_8_21_14_0_10_54_11 TaxID=1974485 RepID=A0A2M6X079_9BACT|nr:MAG: hypothetical protein COT71_00770 [Candidatus Andersenbacteria bacterium CG10_big_fil_rev_8_21_14_0_10_54_11]
MATRRLTHRRQPSNNQLHAPRRLRWLHGGWRIGTILLSAAGIGLLAGGGTILWWSRDLPDPEKINSRRIVESTKIFDRTGTHLLYEIGDIRRTAVPLEAISVQLANATLAAEDDQFYHHHGLDITGILRGVIVKPLSGQRAQGGSTITQQLIKNSILTPERTIRRKVKEAVLALELEQRFSKEKILEMYLNEIPYGSQAYGVEAAAQTYFGTSAKNISLAQAAALAALPKAPTYYSPYGSHFEDMKWRQEFILDRMARLKMISQADADAAKVEELHFQERTEAITAPHFVFYVREQLEQQFGQRIIEEGGLRVITTLDVRLQKIAEEVLSEQADNLRARGASNAALTAIDPQTGDILAMTGSLDYFNEEIDGNVNVAIRHRSPGSSIKPFVYAAAWQKGFTPDTILIDAETDFGQDYRPKNYNLSQRGPITMRAALANSLNIPAVKTLYLAGVREATDLAQAMGFTSLTDPDRYGLSLVLGGGEVRLVDEVSAYGVFGNDGVRHPHRPLLKVTLGNEVLLDTSQDPDPGTQVIPSQLARLISDVISDNNARTPTFGARSALQLGSRPVAAKTGTTQDFRDGWTMGYTPSLAAGVWVGNNDNSPMREAADGVVTAGPIWNSFMRQALSNTPIEQFVKPEPITDIPHPILRGELAEVKGKWEEETKILYTLDCPVALGTPTTFKEIHNILFYVRKDKPWGAPPDRAEADPQFTRWEQAVHAWVDKQKEKPLEPDQTRYVTSLPVPVCNASSAEDLPKVTITEPNTTILKNSPVKITVDVDSPHSLREVRFLLDNEEIARRGPEGPIEASFSFPAQFSGRKTLLVLAITENNLIGRAHRTFIINPDDEPPSINLHTPTDGSRVTAESFPLTVKTTASDANGIELVDVLFRKEGETSTRRIDRTSEISPTAPNRYEVVWQDSPGPGTYEVYTVAYDKTGNPAESSKHTITIE